ncbi:TFIID-18kDa-domain-containing protein [Metschnikowia bicuspidata]|uniref:Transcription initiation factor TFIID subunit 13 n=1 Tax=Metschnikowia bicuspidata TaxID=27322 RepID=A0A4P9ZEB6_9ASCO|nr:TFIID-18kDa-domain-containing protein [Metschnikowia bicuspidata]
MYPYRNQIQPRRRKRQLFNKDIENLLYAMGDGPVSLDATVACLEDCLVDYLTDLAHEALRYARSQGRSRVKIYDLPFALRHDPMKLGRMNYIRDQLIKIERAKKMYDTNNVNNVNKKELFEDADEEDDDEEKMHKSKKPKKKKKKKTGAVSFDGSGSE